MPRHDPRARGQSRHRTTHLLEYGRERADVRSSSLGRSRPDPYLPMSDAQRPLSGPPRAMGAVALMASSTAPRRAALRCLQESSERQRVRRFTNVSGHSHAVRSLVIYHLRKLLTQQTCRHLHPHPLSPVPSGCCREGKARRATNGYSPPTPFSPQILASCFGYSVFAVLIRYSLSDWLCRSQTAA